MDYIKQFMASIEAPNTAKVVRHVLHDAKDSMIEYDIRELEQFVLERKPSSPKAITTICYILGLYARWLQEQGVEKGDAFYDRIQMLKKDTLWKKAKPSAKKKFISYERFCQVIHDIGMYEGYNPLYYQALFKCIYEGIYNDDLSVLKNLRASDINGNTITLHEDNGHTYRIKVSTQLAQELVELAQTDKWLRPNRYGLCRISMRGLYHDSVFKIEDRKTASDDSYKFTFYSKLRKIGDEYLEFSMLPFQLYISGIMHRVIARLEEKNISIEDAFSDNNRDKTVHSIISAELVRSNYSSETGNFREIVKGHLDSF